MNTRQRARHIALTFIALTTLATTLWPGGSQANVDKQRDQALDDARKRPCADPLEGVWVGHKYNTGYWYRLRLEIERDAEAPDHLEGRIASRFWSGAPEDGPQPLSCEGQSDVVVAMEALGSVHEGTVSLIGEDEWTIERVACGAAYDGSYIPDGFIGALDEEGSTLEARWFGIRDRTSVEHERGWEGNDVNYLVGEVRFRRVDCEEVKPPVPELGDVVDAPPPAYRSGCMGCF